MRTVDELLFHLRSLNVKLWANGDRLRYSAPKNVLTPELRAEMLRLKPEILLALERTKRGSRSRPGPIEPVSRTMDLPLSSAQQRLWFLDQLAQDNSVHNTSFALRLRGPLDIGALERGLSEVFRRHESLRTSFPIIDGSPVQMISAPSPIELPTADLRTIHEDGQKEEIERTVVSEGREPFDLATGPLLRFRLLRLGENEHAFIFCMHNIAMDGWSFEVFFFELAALYGASLSDAPSPLRELPFQYADFAAWQRDWLRTELVENQLLYWKRLLARSYRPLRLHADRGRPLVESFQGASQSFSIPKRASETLRALSRREGATLFMTLLAALQALLYRYTGQEDIITFSSAFPSAAGSIRSELRTLIGLFANLLILRSSLEGNLPFRELLGRVREATLGAYENGDLPFERIARFLRSGQGHHGSTPYQVMFILQEGLAPEMAFSGLKVEPFGTPNRSTMFDLQLVMQDTGDNLLGSLLYKKDLFDDRTISRTIAHYQNLLEGIVEDPRQRLSELPLLRGLELRRILVEWNDTSADFPSDKCLNSLVEEQVARSPDAVAIVSNDHRLTYRELNRRANQVARHLLRLGVGAEAPVGIRAERSPEMVIGLLAILKAGGAYVTLSPSCDEERLAFILRDTQMSVLLAPGGLTESLSGHDVRTRALDSGWDLFERESTEDFVSGALAENTACLEYTPDSSAKANGLCFTHRAIVGSVAPSRNQNRFSDEVLLPGVPYVSSESHFEMWSCLLRGGRLRFAGPGALTRGEPRDSIERHSVYWLRTSAPAQAGSHPSVGRPGANARVHILDRHLNPVPVGVPGEVHITGQVLARCYVNQPGITAEAFIPNPLGEGKQDRLYRTGDLARWLSTGDLELLGYTDNRVMIRGIPVEPEVIERALSEHPAVRQALVVAREYPSGGPSNSLQAECILVAYLTGDEDLSAWTLRKFLKKRLPDCMIPSQFIIVQDWPLTPGGDVDRHALPEPEGIRSRTIREYVPPETKTEAIIATIWRDALGVEQIGANDNFFDLGGHSLLAIETISRMEKRLGFRISPKEMVFQTLGQLAASCDEHYAESER